MRSRARCAVACESLLEARRLVVKKVRVVVEGVLAVEEAREEIQYPVEVEIQPGLDVVTTCDVEDVVNNLPAPYGRLARAEIVAAYVKERSACARNDRANSRFGLI